MNKLKIQQTQQLRGDERSLEIRNITSLIECTGRPLTAATRHINDDVVIKLQIKLLNNQVKIVF